VKGDSIFLSCGEAKETAKHTMLAKKAAVILALQPTIKLAQAALAVPLSHKVPMRVVENMATRNS